jgi:hypothetical protein
MKGIFFTLVLFVAAVSCASVTVVRSGKNLGGLPHASCGLTIETDIACDLANELITSNLRNYSNPGKFLIFFLLIFIFIFFT